ncbi:MAG: hypothetical protein PHO83_10400 [Geobacteraceae bacterium]|nr:hypothetical protein [Geobacteraceae bacterium]
MRKQWKISIGIGILALCMPAISLAGPTKEELMIKASQQAKTDLLAKSTTRTKARQAHRAEVKKLHDQKRELLIQKRALRGDPAARQTKMQEIKNVNASLNKLSKGGTK